MKRERSATNAVAVQKVADEMGVTKQFVRQCLRKERGSLAAETARGKYRKVLIEIEAIKA